MPPQSGVRINGLWNTDIEGAHKCRPMDYQGAHECRPIYGSPRRAHSTTVGVRINVGLWNTDTLGAHATTVGVRINVGLTNSEGGMPPQSGVRINGLWKTDTEGAHKCRPMEHQGACMPSQSE